MTDANALRPMRPIKRTPFIEETLPTIGATAPPAHASPRLPGNDKASHKQPCRGYGLNTKERASAFAHRFKQFQHEWPHLNPNQRYTQLHTLANEQLVTEGVPKIYVMQSAFADPGTNGELDQQAWTLNIKRAAIHTASLSPDEAKDLAGTVYHETRHAEQWYLVARAKAEHLQATTSLGPDQQVDEIVREVKVPPRIARAAQKHPLPRDSPQSACAKALYDSICGKDADHRSRVLSRLGAVDAVLPKAAAKADAAEATLERVAPEKSMKTDKSGAIIMSTVQQDALMKSVAASTYWEHLQAEQPVLYQEYRNLPEEFDAFDAEAKVYEAWHP